REQRATGRALEAAGREYTTPAQPRLPHDTVEPAAEVRRQLVAVLDRGRRDLERGVGIEGDEVGVVARRDPALPAREARKTRRCLGHPAREPLESHASLFCLGPDDG